MKIVNIQWRESQVHDIKGWDELRWPSDSIAEVVGFVALEGTDSITISFGRVIGRAGVTMTLGGITIPRGSIVAIAELWTDEQKDAEPQVNKIPEDILAQEPAEYKTNPEP